MDKRYSTFNIIELALDTLLKKPNFYSGFNNNQLIYIVKIFKKYLRAPASYKHVTLQSLFLPINKNEFMIPYKNTSNSYIYLNLIEIIDSILVKMSTQRSFIYAPACYQVHNYIQICWRNLDNSQHNQSFVKWYNHF